MTFSVVPNNQQPSTANQNESLKGLRDALAAMKKEFEHESIQTYIIEPQRLQDHSILVSLFAEYIRDRSGRELPYGEFTVLGKVIRKVEGDETIDLLKSSAFSAINDNVLGVLLNALEMQGNQTFKMPNIITKVKSPALQVIPIAVYI